MSRCGILRADRIIVRKSRREMLLLRGEAILRSYRIALGREPLGHKVQEGDGRTPEGLYVIDRRNPRSAYHLSLHISYPNADDSSRARELGVDPGGDIMIHGLKEGVRHPDEDWTQGCIAVADHEMDEIWGLVADGTPIRIEA
jgi:murein L,D-transpeptidase YafK